MTRHSMPCLPSHRLGLTLPLVLVAALAAGCAGGADQADQADQPEQAGRPDQSDRAGDRSAPAAEAPATGEPRSSEAATQPAGETTEPTLVVIDGDALECESQAMPVSFEMSEASATDVVALFSQFGQVPIRSERDLSNVQVSLTASGLPWDCALQALAEQLDLTVDTQPDGIVLRETP